jgi:hypothetical protein
VPSLHNSQGSNSSDDSGSQGTDGTPQGNDGTPQSNDTGQVADPPGQKSDVLISKPPVASAPELDPATLAAAVTLLLGSLAVLRGRRARARC